MQKTLIPVMLFLFGINLAAQDNLQRGYILRNQNDTVYGFIDDKNYYLNSLFCDFKADHTDSLERFYPGEIYSYRFVDDKYYITKEIKLDGKDSLVFLEYLIHGKVDFYFMQDKGKTNHFYATDSNSPLVELLYNKQVIHKDGKDYLKENKQYKSVLEFLTRATPGLGKNILNIEEPTHRNLINLGENYHNLVCKDWDCVIYHKRMKYKFVIELAGGGKIFSHYNHNDFRSQFTPFAGLKFYFSNPRFSERSYFGIGFFYEGQSVVDSSGVTYWNYKIPVTYSYSSPKKGISPTICAGTNIRNYQDDTFTSVSIAPGMKYNFRSFYVNLYVDFEFGSIVIVPLTYHSTNFGLSLNYKIN